MKASVISLSFRSNEKDFGTLLYVNTYKFESIKNVTRVVNSK